MFDHVFHHSKHRSHQRWHWHTFTALIVVYLPFLIVSSVLILRWWGDISPTTSAQAAATLQLKLRTPQDDHALAVPVQLAPVANLSLSHREIVHLDSFALQVQGIITKPARYYLFIDGVQVGSAVEPDQVGRVGFETGRYALASGVHDVSIRMTATAESAGSILQILFDETSIITASDYAATVTMPVPRASGLITLVEHGSLGWFMQPYRSSAPKPVGSSWYVYARGEDILIDTITVTADQDATGDAVRILIPDQGVIATGQFKGTAAKVSLPAQGARVMQDKNTNILLELIRQADTTPKKNEYRVGSIDLRTGRTGKNFTQTIDQIIFDEVIRGE